VGSGGGRRWWLLVGAAVVAAALAAVALGAGPMRGVLVGVLPDRDPLDLGACRLASLKEARAAALGHHGGVGGVGVVPPTTGSRQGRLVCIFDVACWPEKRMPRQRPQERGGDGDVPAQLLLGVAVVWRSEFGVAAEAHRVWQAGWGAAALANSCRPMAEVCHGERMAARLLVGGRCFQRLGTVTG
jgi:hypothetical protein